MQLTVRDTTYGDPAAAELVAEIQQEYVTRYGGPDETPLDGDEFGGPGGVFVIAYAGDEAIGCAGLRRHDDGVAEVKRMYVRAAHRRRGHGRWLLAALEERARAMGYRRIVLETGNAQPEAIALYTRDGYVAIPDYGHYRHTPLVRSFAKDLSPTPATATGYGDAPDGRRDGPSDRGA